jgi:hypothetical protein
MPEHIVIVFDNFTDTRFLDSSRIIKKVSLDTEMNRINN